jgi:hypothetical protein
MAGLIIVVAAISALDEPSLEKMEKFLTSLNMYSGCFCQ